MFLFYWKGFGERKEYLRPETDLTPHFHQWSCQGSYKPLEPQTSEEVYEKHISWGLEPYSAFLVTNKYNSIIILTSETLFWQIHPQQILSLMLYILNSFYSELDWLLIQSIFSPSWRNWNKVTLGVGGNTPPHEKKKDELIS